MNIFTSYTGDNSDLIRDVSKLYLVKGMVVADVTYGRGVFWRKVDVSMFSFFPSDLKTCPDTTYDFRHLPYKNESTDVVVFDPPYVHNPGNMMMESRYKNLETTKGLYHDDILILYKQGMIEAWRILRVGGLLWVKCKDEIESSTQRWSHVELLIEANKLGYYAKDLFVVTQKSPAVVQHVKQMHARKNHSYLWIFEKSGGDKRLSVQRASLLGCEQARKAKCKQKHTIY